MSQALEFASDLACQAGQLLCEFFRQGGGNYHLKDDYSIVTEADLAVDHLVTGKITEQYPSDSILSEELHPRLPGGEVHAVWIIDPLDGTTNFSLGLPVWGVVIARIRERYPDLAVLYFPVMDELYTAQAGGGAYMNGIPIHVQPPMKDKPATFFSCCGHTHKQYDVRVPYKPRILGSAAYNFCAVARGAAVLGFEATPKIWDLAAGWLLVREAGGVVEAYDGASPFPLSSEVDYARRAYPMLSAATAAVVAKGRDMIRPKLSEPRKVD